jgi:flagellar hook-associated protein 1 FlgK
MSFGGLYISISGLQATKTSLNTISHNISNANNPYYVRQSALHKDNYYKTDGRFQTGTGVSVSQIKQVRDEFLDKKLRRELASFGYHYGKSGTLEDIEGVFNEISNSGLQKIMDGFWDNWNELYKDPESLTMRGLVHESAVAFTETVNHISTQLNNIQQNLNKEILNKVDEINGILNQVAKLNDKIKAVEGQGSNINANDFRDERNGLLDRLAQLIPVNIHENRFGESIISLKGRDLVSGSYVNGIDIKNNPENGLAEIYWKNTNEKMELNSGELAGLIDVRDKSIVNYKARVDTLVKSIAEEINELHKDGFDLQGNGGEDFFKDIDSAGTIKVNPLLSDYNRIAVSTQNDAIGNGDIAKQIYELREILEISDEMNPDEYYKDIVLSLGIEREESRNIVSSQGFLIISIDEKRQSISAVSLDEEMADMIKFQHAYTANSRVINTIDEMIDTIVNRLGVVGR